MGKAFKPVMLVQAPGIPAAEVKALKKHIRSAKKDSAYTIITNYPVKIDFLYPTKGFNLVVTTETGLPVSEILLLRKEIDNPRTKLIVKNYKFRVTQVKLHGQN